MKFDILPPRPHDRGVGRLVRWSLPRHSPFEGCSGLAGAEPQEWERDHIQDSIFVGLDVHKATISVAVARGEREGEVRHWGTVPH